MGTQEQIHIRNKEIEARQAMRLYQKVYRETNREALAQKRRERYLKSKSVV